MNLPDYLQTFLYEEFSLSEADVLQMSVNQLRKLREQCFDVEVEEAVEADNLGQDVAPRGRYATELVDRLMTYIKISDKSKQSLAV